MNRIDESIPAMSSENHQQGKSLDRHGITDVSNEATSTLAEESETKQRSRLRILFSPRILIGLLLLGFIVFVAVDAATNGRVRAAAEVILEWIQENPIWGLFLFTFVYISATVLFIPGSLLTLGAGFVFSAAFGFGLGVVVGTVVVFLGASMGAIASFLLARYLFRDQAARLSKNYDMFEALDLALRDNGLKIFILLRLSPIIPFNIINFLGGVSSVSFRDYVVALIAILPGTILYVFLGASAGSLTDSATSSKDPTITIVVVVVGVVFGVLAIWVTTRYARIELDKILEQRRQQYDESADVDDDAKVDAEVGITDS